jgi:glutathionylspermidine synthase
MKRRTTAPRPDWRSRVEAQGLLYHSLGAPAGRQEYWLEGTYYEVTPREADVLERATRELHALCTAAAGHVIERGRWAEVGVPAIAIPWIEESWRARPPSIYGRMDLAFGADGVPKLLEYNADTPTSLLEGAVIQWTWLEDCFPDADQSNAIHERLIDAWRAIGPGARVHFAHLDDLEDELTVGYLRDTAAQAGLDTIGLRVEDSGWDERTGRLVDLDGRAIETLFKLYPWEGLVDDDFAPLIARAGGTRWIEPAWKMVLSTKGILPILWELAPGHPNLLPASRAPLDGGWVRKPVHGREGANVTIEAPGLRADRDGPYGGEGYVYQAYADLGLHDGMRPVIGSWVIGDTPAGFGIRETEGYITDNTACFIPHIVR